MLRICSAIAVGVTLACAYVLYAMSYDTRKLELSVQASEGQAERLRSEIAILKAERAFLSRPERIEPLARALGLEPARGAQHVRAEARTEARQPPPEQ